MFFFGDFVRHQGQDNKTILAFPKLSHWLGFCWFFGGVVSACAHITHKHTRTRTYTHTRALLYVVILSSSARALAPSLLSVVFLSFVAFFGGGSKTFLKFEVDPPALLSFVLLLLLSYHRPSKHIINVSHPHRCTLPVFFESYILVLYPFLFFSSFS